MVVLLYSTFFMFFFLAELLDTWLWRWASFLIVFILMLLTTAVFALLGYRKVHRIRGPQETIASVKETTSALSPSNLRGTAGATAGAGTALTTSDPAVTYGAVTYESATDPAVTYGAVTYESATDPAVNDPAVNDPAVTYPRATGPRATDPPGWG
jgi:Ca2+/Na+ antiporter